MSWRPKLSLNDKTDKKWYGILNYFKMPNVLFSFSDALLIHHLVLGLKSAKHRQRHLLHRIQPREAQAALPSWSPKSPCPGGFFLVSSPCG